jgi:acyl-ACP thioesterase
MDSEKEYTYEIESEVSFLNENKILKPYAYQTLFNQVVDKHLNNFNLNVDTTLKYNLAWAIISLSIEIVKPVDSCMKLFASTWHSQKKGPFFRREYIFKNEKGETLFQGSSFSILFDVKNRNIYRSKDCPFHISPPNEKVLIEASPTFKTKADFNKVCDRVVNNSYVDCLGHVNNSRYSEFAYDAFTNDEVSNLKNLKRMDIYFESELRNKDNFSILKAYEDNKIFFRGKNNTKEDTSFNIVMQFSSNL